MISRVAVMNRQLDKYAAGRDVQQMSFDFSAVFVANFAKLEPNPVIGCTALWSLCICDQGLHLLTIVFLEVFALLVAGLDWWLETGLKPL